MSTHNHPIEQEELMAYLDGELATNRAVAAAAHLEHCAECQELAADLRKLAQELMAWEVEDLEPSVGTPIAIKAAMQDRPGKPRKTKTRLGWRILLTRRGLVWAGGGTAFVVLLLMTSVSRLKPAFEPYATMQEQHAVGQLRGDDVISTRIEPLPKPAISGFGGQSKEADSEG